MMKQVHVIPHMHWDREWYFSIEESRILLVNNMEEIMERLESDPDYPYYILDGQTAILEDYFQALPSARSRVKKLVQAGRLIIGPWYTQTDEMVVGGESIVRNLMYGIRDAKAFGDYMKIGYLPDSFGQSSQMPQILNGFGIKYAIFWRGMSERHGTNQTEFYWEADDGSKVLVQRLPLGYAIGKYLPEDRDLLAKRMNQYLPVLEAGATTDHLILPNGHDQMPIQKNIFAIIEKLAKLYPSHQFFLSKYEHVFAEIEKNPDLATLKGEFLDGKYMRVHRSIYSTRMDIKAAHTRIENKITNLLEPLATIAYYLGFDYHHGLIESLWKEILKNHAHDSIGCCCSDRVHREIMNRFFLAEEKVDQLIAFYQRKIVDSIQTARTEDRLTAFNLLPYERTEVMSTQIISKYKSFKLTDEENNEIAFEILHQEEMDPGLIDRQIVHEGNYEPFIKYEIQFKDCLPPMGYQTYFVVETKDTMLEHTKAVKTIETDDYHILVNENGTLHIFDKQTEQSFNQVFLFENGGDDGDEYDFSPLSHETLIYSRDVKAKTTIKQNSFATTVDIGFQLGVPSNLEKRQANVIDSFVDIKLSVVIPNHQPLIEVKIEIDNQAKDHRLRLLVPTGIASKCSISDNQFGHIKRDVHDQAMDIWVDEGWDERPDPIYPMLSFVGLSNEDYGVAVLTNSTREFEIVGDDHDTIAVTLFRSVGFLGKGALLRRPGRPSGIKMPTPDSQMLGKIKLRLGLFLHAGSTLSANIGRVAKASTTPIVFYNKIPYQAMKLNDAGISVPVKFSLLREHTGKAVLSTLKKAELSDDYIIRYFNPTDEKCVVEIEGLVTAEAYFVNLNEELIDAKATHENGKISLMLLPNQVKTLALKKI